MSNRRWNALLLAVMVAVCAVVWLPEFGHYYVPTPSFDREVLARLREADRGPAELFDHPHAIGAVVAPLLAAGDPMVQAEQILRGAFRPGYDARPVRFPMAVEDLYARSPEAGLSLASLALPSILLDAYRASGNARYLDAAKQDLLSWSRLERRAWLPLAFLWNDHAIAARTGVLLRFLAISRRLPEMDEQATREALEFTVRGLRFLAKKSHFTFWSNHGVMQNLALLEGAAVLAFLPESATWADVAMERLQAQFAWYVGEDGFVLEDSPGYHRVGVGLLQNAIRLAKLAGRDVPGDWVERHARASRLDSALARPDGTLPVFGDTDSGADASATGASAAALNCSAAEAPLVYPISGLAVYWSRLRSPTPCRGTQLVVKWGHWPGHAHQTPDEMALTLWADGTSWLTNLGYWPYGVPGRKFADSWQASNAPHLLGELPEDDSRRVSGFLGAAEERSALDLSRHAGRGQTIRRQILAIAPDQWICIDSVDGKTAASMETAWTFPPTVSVVPLETGDGFRLTDRQGNDAQMTVFGGPLPVVRMVYGQPDSALGWSMADKMPTRTTSVVVHQASSPGYVAMFLSLGAPERRAARVRMLDWGGPQRWKVEVSGAAGPRLVQRDGAGITWSGEGDSASIQLAPLADAAASQAGDQRRLAEALAQYPKWRDVYAYRMKASKWLLPAALLSLCASLLVGRIPRWRAARWPYLVLISGWALLLVVLPVYFGT